MHLLWRPGFPLTVNISPPCTYFPYTRPTYPEYMEYMYTLIYVKIFTMYTTQPVHFYKQTILHYLWTFKEGNAMPPPPEGTVPTPHSPPVHIPLYPTPPPPAIKQRFRKYFLHGFSGLLPCLSKFKGRNGKFFPDWFYGAEGRVSPADLVSTQRRSDSPHLMVCVEATVYS